MRWMLGLALPLALSFIALDAAAQPFDEATPDTRIVVVEKGLGTHADVVMLYARGLCCGSCAIGIRKKITDLTFVDRGRFTDGVTLDPQHQLVTVAIKNGEKPRAKALAAAIKAAGYDPVSLFEQVDGKVRVTDLERAL